MSKGKNASVDIPEEVIYAEGYAQLWPRYRLVCWFVALPVEPVVLDVVDPSIAMVKELLATHNPLLMARNGVRVYVAAQGGAWLTPEQPGSIDMRIMANIPYDEDRDISYLLGKAKVAVPQDGRVPMLVDFTHLGLRFNPIHDLQFKDEHLQDIARWDPKAYGELIGRRLESDDVKKKHEEVITRHALPIVTDPDYGTICLDGTVNRRIPTTRSSIFFAFSPDGRVQAAKVFAAIAADIAHVEFDRSHFFRHPNIIKFDRLLLDGERRIILMPFFPRSVADLLMHESPVASSAICTIAFGCVKALRHIHAKFYCYGNIKPSNIMLRGTDRDLASQDLIRTGARDEVATLIDFGAITPLDSRPLNHECAFEFALDAERTASRAFDWICLGSMLATLAGCELWNFTTAEQVATSVERASHLPPTLVTFIVGLLRGPHGLEDSSTFEDEARSLVETITAPAIKK